ncbi:MAG: hypothetical protein V4561_09635 [Bacteroidota bacterium]
MKKQIFLLSALSLALFSACKKESLTNEKSNVKQTSTNTNLMRTGGVWRAYQSDDDCAGYGTNCYELEPIVIKSGTLAALSFAAGSGSSATVGTVFGTPDLDLVIADMDQTEATKLLSGNYFITLNHESGYAINYMAGTTFPVTAQNMDFAFQIKK